MSQKDFGVKEWIAFAAILLTIGIFVGSKAYLYGRDVGRLNALGDRVQVIEQWVTRHEEQEDQMLLELNRIGFILEQATTERGR